MNAPILNLTARQKAAVQAAAALLRVRTRHAFLRDVTVLMMKLRRPITDADVMTAINTSLGVKPFLGDPTQQEASHGQNATVQR